MTTNVHRPTFRAPAILLVVGVMALLVVPLFGQIRSGFKGSGSKYPEYFELPLTGGSQTNRLRGMFLGTEWQHLSNKVFRVTAMRIEHYEMSGGTNLIAIAPECFFDVGVRVAWSTGRLDIVGMNGGITIRGNRGFQARMADSTLTISNRVRTVLQRELIRPITP